MSETKKAALVTGASSGLGEVFARKLAARGYDLILVARRKERLDALAAELKAKHGTDSETIVADLVEDADRARVEQRIRSAANLEFLVNNAGFGTLKRFWVEPVESQDAMHRLHVLTTMRLTHEALPGMIARGAGYIINVSSVSAFIREGGGVSYPSTKAWVNRFTETLAGELRAVDSKVRVQALCPGFTYTEFHDVLQMDRGFVGPKWWLPAEFVVDESLAGADRGELFVVPGTRYKVMAWCLQHLPKSVIRMLMPSGVKNRASYVKKD
jgi:short-subunit dehydrogenase